MPLDKYGVTFMRSRLAFGLDVQRQEFGRNFVEISNCAFGLPCRNRVLAFFYASEKLFRFRPRFARSEAGAKGTAPRASCFAILNHISFDTLWIRRDPEAAKKSSHRNTRSLPAGQTRSSTDFFEILPVGIASSSR